MKIQCACGTKYSFDITPEMARSPIKLVCQNCGADNSAAVNQVIQQQFGAAAPVPAGRPQTPPPVVVVPPPPGARLHVPGAAAVTAHSLTATSSGPQPVAPLAAPALRVSVAHPAPAAPVATTESSTMPAAGLCAKHSNQPATHRCLVCQKPMCPKCMEVFGYVCSGYCKGKAENQGIAVPAYAGQKARAQSRETEWLGKALAGFFILFALVMGTWAWYAWIGSVPKVVSSARFTETAHSGQLHMVGPEQAALLHGGRLIRHDFKEKKEVWSTLLYDEQRLISETTTNYNRVVAEYEKIIRQGGEVSGELGTLEEAIESAKRDAAAKLHLHARGETIWVSSPDKLTRHDWASGKSSQDIPLEPGERRLISNGDELLVAIEDRALMRINLLSGETRTERAQTGEAARPAGGPPTNTVARAADPSRTRNLTPVERMVKPAITAANANQQRLADEMRNPATPAAPASAKPAASPGDTRLTVSRHGAIQVTARQLGVRTVDGRGVTMYQATARGIGTGAGLDWTGEVPGFPEVYPLQTVGVLAADKLLVVFDKSGKKLWEAKLESGLRPALRIEFAPQESPSGDGPCVEDKDALYVYDGASVTAFDLASGVQRWRFAASSTEGLVLDGQGGLYVNGMMSGGDNAYPLVQKLDAKTGKLLWRAEREGLVRYASGKFVYAYESYRGDADDSDGLPGMKTIFHVSAYVRIKRLDAATGRSIWHHIQERCPLDARFENNTFQLLFKKEVQAFKFISL